VSTFEQRATVVVVGIWIVGVLISIGLTVGAVAVAIHFIQKFW
jgi:hypothetical protein